MRHEPQLLKTQEARNEVRREPRLWAGATAQLLSLLLLWAVPVGAVVIAVPLASVRESQSVAPPLPTVVTVGSQSIDYRVSVTVLVDVDPLGQVRAPVSGLLTSVSLVDGPALAGQELFAIDGVPVLAQPGVLPFYRELRRGDEGADVEVLSRFLIDLGMLDKSLASEKFGNRIRAAVVLLQTRLGVHADGVFSPAYVAFVPQSAGELGSALLSVGTMLAVGDVVFDTAPVAARITFIPTSEGTSLVNLEGAPLTLTFDSLQIPVASLNPEDADLGAIHEGLREAVSAGVAQYAEETSAGPNVPEQYSGGLLSLAQPQVRGVVPGTAVYISTAGAQCIFRQQQGGDWIPVPMAELEAAVGSLGTMYVEASLIDLRIARDPLALADDVLAQCS